MRHPVARALGIAVSLGTLAACTSDPSDASEQPGDEVTGGEIIVGGDLNDDVATTAVATAPATVDPPAPATSSTAAPTTTRPPSTISTISTVNTMTTAPARPTTTDAEVVGDGPVLTAPGSEATSETPGVGGALVPAFFALEASPTVDCSASNPGTVRLRWEVIGTEAVDIAIGSTTRIFRLAQPPAGALDVPLDCTSGSEYFVIASNADGSTTRSVSLAPDATA